MRVICSITATFLYQDNFSFISYFKQSLTAGHSVSEKLSPEPINKQDRSNCDFLTREPQVSSERPAVQAVPWITAPS